MVAENVGPDKGCALIQELKSYGRLNNSSGSLLCNRITVVQAAESRQGLNLAFSSRANCCWPTRWGVLRETQVRSIIVVIEHVLGHQPFEMPFIQDDYVVKQVSSATSNPALSDTVLPRTAKGKAGWLASDVPYRRNHIGSEL